ncbi:uncharacterized protein LOC134196550 isoform X2 [Corticium candelabrum]|uniref:uncharacterized protein LOC134196550 isoform X2 n=1 Tax=Corticium candelabrum TaxID=121492 RepID=UPI002E26B695|nr:uncharacterized protein LOC134196550 isoform X2 [Corticium candelabrum]
MSAANRKRKQNAKANNSKVDKLADIENGERNEKSICDDETDITERVIDGHPDYWRLKYEKLLEQRTTEAEQKLVDITKKAADQLTSSDARVKTLESQVTDLETRLSTTTSNHVQETGKQMESKHCQTMEEPTNKDEKKVSEIQMVNGFYNLLTGITIQPTKTSDTVDTFCCSFTNGPPGHECLNIGRFRYSFHVALQQDPTRSRVQSECIR